MLRNVKSIDTFLGENLSNISQNEGIFFFLPRLWLKDIDCNMPVIFFFYSGNSQKILLYYESLTVKVFFMY